MHCKVRASLTSLQAFSIEPPSMTSLDIKYSRNINNVLLHDPTYPSHQSHDSASSMVALLSNSSLSSAAAMLSGTLLPTKSLSRALDTSRMPSNDGQRDSCTYKL